MIALWTALGAGAAIVGSSGAYFAPQVLRRGADGRLRRAIVKHRLLALTYDDGPSSFTPLILERLNAAEAKGTFFLLGSRARAMPDMVERIASAGHEVASHGEEHINAWRAGPSAGAGNVRRAQASLARWIGPREGRAGGGGIFRPPYGRLSLPTWWAARRIGLHICWWTLDSGDTAAALPDKTVLVQDMARHGGGVVLLHDFERKDRSRVQFTLDVTDALLSAAKAEGIRACTVSELLQSAEDAAG